MGNQNLFDALERVCDLTALQTDMSEILAAVEKDRCDTAPLTEEESEIFDLLALARNKFCKLSPDHPSDLQEWVQGIHQCQAVITSRLVARLFPKTFASYRK
jgi:hypothetical protein